MRFASFLLGIVVSILAYHWDRVVVDAEALAEASREALDMLRRTFSALSRPHE